MHWSTLIEGTEIPYQRDVEKKNKAVQSTINNGLSMVKIYSRRINKFYDCVRFLKELGNRLNDVVTGKTPLEIWRYTLTVEMAFAKKKSVMGWTITGVGQSQMDSLKFSVATSLYPDIWATYVEYEVTKVFFKESQTVTS